MALTLYNKPEEQVLGYLIADPKLYYSHAPRLTSDLFQEHQDVWEAYLKVVSEGGKPNMITISRGLEGRQDAFNLIGSLTKSVDFSVDFESWLEHLEHRAKRTYCEKAVQDLNNLITKDSLDDFEKVLHNSLMGLSKQRSDYKPMIDHVKDVFTHVENIQAGKKITGTPTGFTDFDEFSGGLQPSDLTIIAATTSQGKTTLALTMAYNMAIQSATDVGVFSLEMSMLQITARLIGMDTDIPSKNILSGNVTFPELNKKLGAITNNKIHIDPTRDTKIQSIISKMRYFIARFGCKVFVIDYLQMITNYVKGQTTEQNVADVCRMLKAFAKENNISIVLLCQLNRGEGGNPAPKMSRLRGSGQIEEAADNVLLLFRPDYYNINTFDDGTDALGKAELILDKGRNIGTARFRLEFIPQIPTFKNITSDGQRF